MTAETVANSQSNLVARENAKGLRFLRDIKFPRFSMRAGEIWEAGFDPVRGLGGTARNYYAAIDSGDDRFEFAGGVCLVRDVTLVVFFAEEIAQRKERRRRVMRN